MATQHTSAKHRARSASTGRFIGPKAGARVTVPFGNRQTSGVVVRRTITGRYAVNVDVPGADAPVMATYEPAQILPQ